MELEEGRLELSKRVWRVAVEQRRRGVEDPMMMDLEISTIKMINHFIKVEVVVVLEGM